MKSIRVLLLVAAFAALTATIASANPVTLLDPGNGSSHADEHPRHTVRHPHLDVGPANSNVHAIGNAFRHRYSDSRRHRKTHPHADRHACRGQSAG